jgi:superfamily II DNA or RNA helicase
MYLSKRGYVIRKSEFTDEALLNIKLELRGKPLVDNKFAFPGANNTDTTYPIYIDTKTKLYIPKMYGVKKFGIPEIVTEYFEGKEWDHPIDFKGQLLEHQVEPVNTLIQKCKEDLGGILTLPTGFGKTVSLLYVLSQLKGKTIIIVNKIPLMNQWISEINKFLPNAKVGTIQGQKNVDIQDCDIVVAMLQSMARIDYPDELFREFRICVIDEVHNIASKVFSKVLFKLCSKYTIGLSATPKRSDGCEYVFKWHLGDIVYETKSERKGKPPIIRYLKIDTKEYKEISTENKFTGQKQIQFTSMLSELVEMNKRNELIVDIIKELIHKEEGRKILVLSDRRNHLQTIKNFLDEDLSITFTYGLFLGGMKQKDLEQGRKCQVILATYQAFGEGVSEKELDTLLLITPKKFIGHLKNTTKNESGKLEQIVGRIFRKAHTERNPLIIDFQDNFSVYKSQASQRKNFYKQHFQNASFEDHSINLDDVSKGNYISFIKIKKKKEKESMQEEDKLANSILNYCILDD